MYYKIVNYQIKNGCFHRIFLRFVINRQNNFVFGVFT